MGLYGTIGGAFSYTTGSITPDGSGETAPVSTSGGLLTIVDGNNVALTATVSGIEIATFGTAGSFNVEGAINLTNIHYSGMNADLLSLTSGVTANGGIVALSFQFDPGESLSQLAASGADFGSSYSGLVATATVPEPGSLLLGCIALGTFGIAITWRKCLRSACA